MTRTSRCTFHVWSGVPGADAGRGGDVARPTARPLSGSQETASNAGMDYRLLEMPSVL